MRWTENIEIVGKMRNSYDISFGKSKRKIRLGRYRSSKEYKNKTHFKEIMWECVEWNHLAQDMFWFHKG
jgi:hypothetical protein